MSEWELMGYMANKSQKLMLLLYALCKAGVVKFDLNNVEHVELLFRLRSFIYDWRTNEPCKVTHDTESTLFFAMLKRIEENVIPRRDSK